LQRYSTIQDSLTLTYNFRIYTGFKNNFNITF